eukprot:sb/3476122/
MDVSAIAAIAKEVRINAKAKETGNDKATLVSLSTFYGPLGSPRTLTELGNILQSRQSGTGAPIKQKKVIDDGMSPELQALLAKRNKIIEEDEEKKEAEDAKPEFHKINLKKTTVEVEETS